MPFALPIWLLPYAAPVLAKLAALAPWWPGFGALKRWVRVGSYVAVLAAGVWFGGKALAWWQGDLLTAREAKEQASAALAAATLAAREKAVAEKERTLAAREALVAADEMEITQLEQELAHARGNLQSGGGVAVRVDDEWLRAWMARRR